MHVNGDASQSAEMGVPASVRAWRCKGSEWVCCRVRIQNHHFAPSLFCFASIRELLLFTATLLGLDFIVLCTIVYHYQTSAILEGHSHPQTQPACSAPRYGDTEHWGGEGRLSLQNMMRERDQSITEAEFESLPPTLQRKVSVHILLLRPFRVIICACSCHQPPSPRFCWRRAVKSCMTHYPSSLVREILLVRRPVSSGAACSAWSFDAASGAPALRLHQQVGNFQPPLKACRGDRRCTNPRSAFQLKQPAASGGAWRLVPVLNHSFALDRRRLRASRARSDTLPSRHHLSTPSPPRPPRQL